MATEATATNGNFASNGSAAAPTAEEAAAPAAPAASAPPPEKLANGSSSDNAAEKPAHRFDPNFTQHVIDTMGPGTSDRNRIVLGSLIRHLHDFAREVELTIPEWYAGVQYINRVGQIFSKTRNEAHRVSDILGLES